MNSSVKLVLQLVYPLVSLKDVLRLALVSKEWSWNLWREEDKKQLIVSFLMQSLRNGLNAYNYECQVAWIKYSKNGRNVKVETARNYVCLESQKSRYEDAYTMWQKKDRFFPPIIELSPTMIFFKDGILYADVEFSEFLMLKWKTKPFELNYGDLSDNEEVNNGWQLWSDGENEAEMLVGSAVVSNVITGTLVFEGKVKVIADADMAYGDHWTPHFCVGRLYSKEGRLIAEGDVNSSCRKPGRNCDVYYYNSNGSVTIRLSDKKVDSRTE
jgi:hypothetical protein